MRIVCHVAGHCFCQAARAVLLLVCWIPFNYTGYPLTWRSALVIMWGGLRGAVGMVMALFIFLDQSIHDPSFKSYCIFYMGSMAFFTVLINGGTTKALLEWLGFMSYTPEQLGTLHHVIEDMDEMREKRLAQLHPDEVLGEPEPDAVNVSVQSHQYISLVRTVRNQHYVGLRYWLRESVRVAPLPCSDQRDVCCENLNEWQLFRSLTVKL